MHDLMMMMMAVPHNILRRKLNNFELSSSYVGWFDSYLVKRQSVVRISGTLSFPYLEKSGMPQGSILSHLLFNLRINDTCDSIHNSKYL
jgi:hypothetical protein